MPHKLSTFPSFLFLLCVPAFFGQVPTSGTITATMSPAQSSPPSFDVASVKLHPNCQAGTGVRAGISPRNLALPCVTLRGLIRLAYGDVLVDAGLGARRTEVTGGPGWLDTERYDVLAKSDGTTPSAGPMLRTLLEERFRVKVHKEGRDSSVYILSVATGGAMLAMAKDGSCIAMDLNNLLPPAPPKQGEARPRYCGLGGLRSNGSLMVTDWYGTSIAELAGRLLPDYVDLPVVDQTKLSDRYDTHLEFVPERSTAGPVTLNGEAVPGMQMPSTDTTIGPSIFSALEKQLGLKLSKGKASLDVVVVDHAERPSAN